MSNPDLAELQRLFKSYLVGEKLSIKGGKHYLNSTKNISLRTRVSIYHYAYFSRILETLEEDFPKLLLRLGKRKFSGLVRQYLGVYPSQEPNIMELGGAFPNFIKEQGLSLESDLATFEWLLKLSEFARDAEPTNLGELSKLSSQEINRISFVMAPSVFLFQAKFPVHEKKITTRKKTYLLIYRKRGKLAVENLSKDAFDLFQALSQGKSLGRIGKQFYKSKITLEVQSSYFSKWVETGVISHWTR